MFRSEEEWRKLSRQEAQQLVQKQLMPHVNAALRSRREVSHHVERLGIFGSLKGVRVLDISRGFAWVGPLLLALKTGDYRHYTVKLLGNAPDVERSPVELKQKDARRFLDEHPKGYLSVYIAP